MKIESSVLQCKFLEDPASLVGFINALEDFVDFLVNFSFECHILEVLSNVDRGEVLLEGVASCD